MIRADQVVKASELLRSHFGDEVKLVAIEVPGEDYEAMLEQHRVMCHFSILGATQDPKLPVVFEIDGVRIEKRKAKVTPEMAKAGANLLRSHEGMKLETVAVRLYQEMQEVADRERRT